MPAITKGEAIERLAKAVETVPAYDLAEVYTELFPNRPAPDAAGAKGPPLAKQMAARIRGGLEAAEIVDLWNVVFPEDRNVYYDEEDNLIRFNERVPRYAE